MTNPTQPCVSCLGPDCYPSLRPHHLHVSQIVIHPSAYSTASRKKVLEPHHAHLEVDAAQWSEALTQRAPRFVPTAAAFSQGIPLYVYELSRWLRNRVKIEGDGTVALTAGVNSGTIVPPSVHSLVQSHIDAIPAALQQLLRCASVIGVGFEEPLLLKVVQLETDTTEAAVHRHLCHLGELHLLNQTPDGNWQVCSSPGADPHQHVHGIEHTVHAR